MPSPPNFHPGSLSDFDWDSSVGPTSHTASASNRDPSLELDSDCSSTGSLTTSATLTSLSSARQEPRSQSSSALLSSSSSEWISGSSKQASSLQHSSVRERLSGLSLSENREKGAVAMAYASPSSDRNVDVRASADPLKPEPPSTMISSKVDKAQTRDSWKSEKRMKKRKKKTERKVEAERPGGLEVDAMGRQERKSTSKVDNGPRSGHIADRDSPVSADVNKHKHTHRNMSRDKNKDNTKDKQASAAQNEDKEGAGTKTSSNLGADSDEARPKPETGSKSSPNPRLSPPWRISPNTLRLLNCPCITLKSKYVRTLQTSEQMLRFNMARFEKVWLRVAHLKLYPEVRAAAERLFLGLRGRGWELIHLVARELQSRSYPASDVGREGRGKRVGAGVKGSQGQGGEGAGSEGRQRGRKQTRTEISIVFLYPDYSNEVIGHRPLAELLVHLHQGGDNDREWKGTPSHTRIENVAVRYEEDWEDWTVCQPHVYLKPAPAPQPKPQRALNANGDDEGNANRKVEGDANAAEDGVIRLAIPDKSAGITGGMILDNVLLQLQTLLEWRSVDAKQLRSVLTRASTELKQRQSDVAFENGYGGGAADRVANATGNDTDMGNGRRVCAFEMEMVYRQTQWENITLPCIRIALKVIAPKSKSKSNSTGRSKTTSGNRKLSPPDRQAKSEPEPEPHQAQAPRSGPRPAQTQTQETGAVVLLDLNDLNGRRVKHISVIYEDDWPIAHVYKDLPAP